MYGKPEGFGQYKWSNGSVYKGQFLNGLKHGHGKWRKQKAGGFTDEKSFMGNTITNTSRFS